MGCVDFGPHLDNWEDLRWCQVGQCEVVLRGESEDITFSCN